MSKFLGACDRLGHLQGKSPLFRNFSHSEDLQNIFISRDAKTLSGTLK